MTQQQTTIVDRIASDGRRIQVIVSGMTLVAFVAGRAMGTQGKVLPIRAAIVKDGVTYRHQVCGIALTDAEAAEATALIDDRRAAMAAEVADERKANDQARAQQIAADPLLSCRQWTRDGGCPAHNELCWNAKRREGMVR